MEEDKSHIKLVRQHNLLTQARYSLSATELDVFFALLRQINYEGTPKQSYTIDLDWMEAISGKRPHATHLRHATEKMMRRIYSLVEDDGSYTQVALLSSAKYIANERRLLLRVDPEMEKYLFDLKDNYTLYHLEHALRLNSKFSKRLYQMLSQFRSTGIFKTTIARLKEQLGLFDEVTGEEQYEKISAFRKYVLDVAQSELEDTDVRFSYSFVKEGRSFIGIHFHIISDALPMRNPKAAFAKIEIKPEIQGKRLMHSEETEVEGKRLLYDRMTSDYNLEHAHIASIFKAFSMKEINLILYKLQLEFKEKGVINKGYYTIRRFEMEKAGFKA